MFVYSSSAVPLKSSNPIFPSDSLSKSGNVPRRCTLPLVSTDGRFGGVLWSREISRVSLGNAFKNAKKSDATNRKVDVSSSTKSLS
ncbi:hypothetical protein KIN20_018658 [Parelaphostrongylus tenuis]|uniref:Uncharacterized protein n=1 Tax=Parelaphostrongylus tenuis TaxID=148309 RepID=A0AAD5MNC1_PARTN|nr:hypothetical protein KIN20_018658 [Parelaphostrongylus tenuis]